MGIDDAKSATQIREEPELSVCSGHSLLPRMHKPEEAHKARGLNDLMVFSAQSII